MPTPEELNAMTLQVGLVGSDGIVLASDRLMQQIEQGARSTGTVSKFLYSDSVTCCWSGDSMAENAANKVWDLDWTSVTDLRRQLVSIGKETKEECGRSFEPGTAIRKVIVACHALPSLWLLDLTWASPTVHERLDCVATGDSGNTCRHFLNRYAPGCEVRPVAELVRLAAYAVLVAGDENPRGIAGLEVVVVQNGKAVFLTKEQERELMGYSEALSETIRQELMRPFSVSAGPSPPRSQSHTA
jgi:hypothetical protein